MAHIRRRTNGRWQARYRDPSGREHTRDFARKVDAERFLVTSEGAKLRGDWVDPSGGRTPLADWSETWLDVVRPTLKPKTLAGYGSLMRSRILPTFGAMPLAAIRLSDVQTWVGGMQEDGLSASRIRQAHGALSSMLDAAVRESLIARNVARGARLPKLERREAAFLDTTTVDAMVIAAPDDYRAFIAIQGVLGLRFGEAAALRRRSVNLLRRRIRVEESLAEIGGELIFGPTKTHAARSVPIPPSLAALLAKHMENVPGEPAALLFTSSRGLPLRYSRFRPTVWLPLLAQLDLPHVGMHALRHSAAARMIGAGWSAKAVQQTLGHATAGFTLTVYGHLFEDDLDALANALDGSPRGHFADIGSP